MSELVSVVVVTYNSSKFVCETLESIFNQNYDRLELIVSDDSSSDDTICVVEKWMKEHKNRFERCEIISTPINTGIPANCNRGINASSGKWIKVIAGDDILVIDCISKCIEYVNQNLECNVLFSRIKRFRIENGNKVYFPYPSVIEDPIYMDNFVNSDGHGQFYLLLKDGCFLPAPSAFFRAQFIKEHPYIEKYKYEDDYPLWLNLTKNGYKLDFIPNLLVEYRNDYSLSSRITDYYSRPYMKTRNEFFWSECYDYFKDFNLTKAYNDYRKMLLKYEITEAFLHNKRTRFNSLMVRMLNKCVDLFARFDF